MAQTPEEFRNQERRKMRLQAALNARRKSLMNLVAPRGVYAEEGPGTSLPVYEELTPRLDAPRFISGVTQMSRVIEPPAPLPGRDIVDANHSAAINLARQNPGVNLTDELNRRAAAQTGLDRMNIGFGGVVPESDTAVVQDLYRQNAIDATAAHPTPAHQTQTTVTADNPIAHWPDPMSIRDAGVDYGPGGTTPLTGITRIGSRQVAFPSDERLQSSSTQLTNAVRKIKKRAAIIRGTAALVGGDQKAADRYEAKALASLGVYAGQYAMSQLTDADFQDKQTLFQSLLAKNMPLDQILQVLDSGVVDRTTGQPELKQVRAGSDFVTYQVYPDGSMKEFSRSPISASTPKTELSVDLGKSGDAFGQKLGDAIGQVLGGGEDDVFEKLKADNIQIGPLIEALESGQVQTGKGQEFFKDFKGLLGQFLPESKTQALFNKNAGMVEWWKSTVDSFGGLKLAMTKGAISDKEMKLFMDMIPSLSKTEDGNLILLRSMRALNNIALAQEAGTLDYIKDLAKRGQDVGTESASQQTVDWYKFWNRRKELAIKDFHRVTKGYPETRDEAFLILRTDPKLKELDDKQIHEHLNQYYPEVSADG